jgi:hypothetical protein
VVAVDLVEPGGDDLVAVPRHEFLDVAVMLGEVDSRSVIVGVPLPGARVVVLWSGESRETRSGPGGGFAFCELPDGAELDRQEVRVHALRHGPGEPKPPLAGCR